GVEPAVAPIDISEESTLTDMATESHRTPAEAVTLMDGPTQTGRWDSTESATGQDQNPTNTALSTSDITGIADVAEAPLGQTDARD
ncbi:hypothetical protein C6A85_26745, partial [Mycobacterium sp. ITM-2017-0098]